MKRNIKKLFFATFFLSITTFSFLKAADSVLTMESNKETIGKGELLRLRVQMSWKQSDTDLINIIKVSPPSSSFLTLIDSKQTTSSELTSDGVYAKKIMEYDFKAVEEGTGTIEPLVVEYVKGDSETTEIVKSNTVSIKVLSSHVAAIKKISSIILISFLLLLLLWLTGLIKNIKVKKQPQKSISDELEQHFLSTFKNFAKYKIQGDYAKYYMSVGAAIKKYINMKYNVDLDITVPSESKYPSLMFEEVYRLFNEWNDNAEKIRFSGVLQNQNELEKLERQTEKYFHSLIPETDQEEFIEVVD